jgi:copper chaperone
MTTETLSVPDIHCGHCKSSIEGAVGALDGIDSVDVDVDAASVAVAYSTDAVAHDDIVAAIEGQGYEVATSQ